MSLLVLVVLLLLVLLVLLFLLVSLVLLILLLLLPLLMTFMVLVVLVIHQHPLGGVRIPRGCPRDRPRGPLLAPIVLDDPFGPRGATSGVE